MNNLKFRAWDEAGKRWLHGYAENGEGCSIIGETIFCGGWLSEVPFSSPDWNKIIIEQFTGLRDKNGREIYKGDIVKVFTNRVSEYESEWKLRSKYDAKKIESRSVIVFKRFEWRLNTDTEYNRKILELKGSETEKRRLTIREHLNDYDFFQESNPSSAWNRKHNSHAYWCDIEVIGNIHENQELLNE